MKILIIEEIEYDYQIIKTFLNEINFPSFSDVHCRNLSEGLIYAGSGDYDVILLDIQLPDSEGINAFIKLSEIIPTAPIVILCNQQQELKAAEITEMGAEDYLVKEQLSALLLYRSIKYAVKSKTAEKKLIECRAKLHTLTENTNNMIVSVDNQKRMIAANSVFADFFRRYTGHEPIPGDFLIDFMPDKIAKFYSKIFNRGLTGDSFSEEYQIELSDGASIYLDFSVYPIFSEFELMGFNCFIQNITDRKETERKLDKYLKELKALNTTKDKFFTIISHDLRNPILNSLNSLSLIMNSYEEMTDHEILENICGVHKSFQNIYNLLEELLLWARSQVGQIEYMPEKFDVNYMVESVFSVLTGSARVKNIELINNIGQNEIVFADPSMISTVLRNLVSNAIKFTFSGGKVTVTAASQDDYFAVISIKDSGIGISNDVRNKLFRIDEAVTSPGTDEESGTGLGLVLCREFVERNKGKIWVESVLGEGSEFKFTLPRGEL